MLALIFVAIFVVLSVFGFIRLRHVPRQNRLMAAGLFMLGFLFIPLWVPWAGVGIYTVKCGRAPVVSNTGYAARYYSPANPNYRKAVSFANPTLFCTEGEAKANSLQESSFDPAP